MLRIGLLIESIIKGRTGKMHKKITLKNGLRIITVPMKNTGTVTALVLVGTGSKYETKEINGISHFLEHMFFKGTKKHPDARGLNEPLDRIGGMYNAFTSKECTGYWAKVDSSHLDIVLDWVSDIYLNSKLNSKEIQKEKGVIIEEINMYFDDPMSYVHILWEKLLYGDQPAGWDITGTKESVMAVNRKKLLNYVKNHYSSQNTLICLAGNINTNSSIEKIKRYFKTINTLPVKAKLKIIDASVFCPSVSSVLSPNKVKMVERQEHSHSLIHFKKIEQAHFCLGVRGYNLFHPQKYVQDILANILGGMMSSRLWISVRGKNGLAYYVHTESESATDTGYLVTSAGVNVKKIEDAIKIILKEYKKISRTRVSESELQKAKDNIKGKMALNLETSSSQAFFCGMQELLEGKILSAKEIYTEIDKVQSDDILKVAKALFQSKNFNLALLGPHKNVGGAEGRSAKFLKKLLKNYV
jgi:predicted Zn-dependent peptidase